MNYYNDNDPKACAWLCELIAATSDQDRKAGSASDQAARGTLDTAPTHAQANGCCTRFAMLRFVRGQACAPSREPAILRKPHRPLAHLDCDGGIEQGLSPAPVSPSFAADRVPRARGCACATRARFERYERDGSHQSTSTSGSAQDVHGTSCHRPGMAGAGPWLLVKPSSGMRLRTLANRTGCLHAETRMTSRSCRNGVFSWLHNCISLRGAQ